MQEWVPTSELLDYACLVEDAPSVESVCKCLEATWEHIDLLPDQDGVSTSVKLIVKDAQKVRDILSEEHAKGNFDMRSQVNDTLWSSDNLLKLKTIIGQSAFLRWDFSAEGGRAFDDVPLC